MIEVVHFSDPGCPWAWSASPALAVLRWRYGDGLRWRLVTVGLAETPERYVKAGYRPERMATGYATFRTRFGMPFSVAPKERVAATSRACRAIVSARLDAPEREWSVFRALQVENFTSGLPLDSDTLLAAALRRAGGVDSDAILARLDDEDVRAAYEADKAQTRTAAGSPTEAQGKAGNTDGTVRYTAPSLVFTGPDGRRLEGGGFQRVEAYDLCVANLEPELPRRPPPESPLDALDAEPDGLTTQEVAASLAAGNDAPDRAGAEAALIALVGEGRARREPVGDDALWFAA